MGALDELAARTGDLDLPDPADLRGQARGLVAAATGLGVSVGTAESCTGGLVSGWITAVPGSSAAMQGGIVSYALSAKVALLGVSQETLDAVGAVSEDCARQMSEGARRALGCDVAVAVTGIAGPGGAVPGKPVGTVWLSVATPSRTVASRRLFSGDRDAVRAKTASVALALLRAGVEETGAPAA